MTSLALSIVVMSFLNRSDDAAVPSWRVGYNHRGRCAALCGHTINVANPSCLAHIGACDVRADTHNLSAVVAFSPAERPKAILKLPVVLLFNALAPQAVLPTPLGFLTSVLSPTARLSSPSVLSKSALVPKAAFQSLCCCG